MAEWLKNTANWIPNIENDLAKKKKLLIHTTWMELWNLRAFMLKGKNKFQDQVSDSICVTFLKLEDYKDGKHTSSTEMGSEGRKGEYDFKE